jgi:L-amino acid N-acyltransferase YncA
MDLVIRAARRDDAASMIAVLNPIIASGTAVTFDAPITEDAEARYIAGFPEHGVFLVAERSSDETIVGLQSTEPFADYTRVFDHVGVIGTYVDPVCQRQGIATRLFAATFVAARCKGFEKLFTYIRADNDAALAAYGSQGFEVVGRARRHARIGDRFIDEIMVERFL